MTFVCIAEFAVSFAVRPLAATLVLIRFLSLFRAI
jgi:hypothetical protein